MSGNIYLYIAVMAGVTYLIRVLPLTLIRKQIDNRFVQSFLYYVPYATLSAMTFPAILEASVESGAKYVIVEQAQSYDTPCLEAAKSSRDYLKKLGW